MIHIVAAGDNNIIDQQLFQPVEMSMVILNRPARRGSVAVMAIAARTVCDAPPWYLYDVPVPFNLVCKW